MAGELMQRLRLALFVVTTVAAMAWLVTICRAGDDGNEGDRDPGPLFFPVPVESAPRERGVPQSLLPTEIAPAPVVKQQLREVVILVPNFQCGACEWCESNVLRKIPGIKITKRVDMNRPHWPWVMLGDTDAKPIEYPKSPAVVEKYLRDNPPKTRSSVQKESKPRAAGG